MTVIEPGGLLEGAWLLFTLRKEQGRKDSLKVETLRDINNPLPHNEVRSGHRECISVFPQENTLREGL